MNSLEQNIAGAGDDASVEAWARSQAKMILGGRAARRAATSRRTFICSRAAARSAGGAANDMGGLAGLARRWVAVCYNPRRIAKWRKTLRGGAVAARQAHNLKVVGSNPTPAT